MAQASTPFSLLATGPPQFLKYLDMEDLERDMVVEAHMDESSGGDDQ